MQAHVSGYLSLTTLCACDSPIQYEWYIGYIDIFIERQNVREKQ